MSLWPASLSLVVPSTRSSFSAFDTEQLYGGTSHLNKPQHCGFCLCLTPDTFPQQHPVWTRYLGDMGGGHAEKSRLLQQDPPVFPKKQDHNTPRPAQELRSSRQKKPVINSSEQEHVCWRPQSPSTYKAGVVTPLPSKARRGSCQDPRTSGVHRGISEV